MKRARGSFMASSRRRMIRLVCLGLVLVGGLSTAASTLALPDVWVSVWSGSQVKDEYLYYDLTPANGCFFFAFHYQHWNTTHVYGYTNQVWVYDFRLHDGSQNSPYELYWNSPFVADAYGDWVQIWVPPGTYSFQGSSLPYFSIQQGFLFDSNHPAQIAAKFGDASYSPTCRYQTSIQMLPY